MASVVEFSKNLECAYAIVIPTCNRPKLLLDLLRNLGEVNEDDFTVIVVDSSDTPLLASEFDKFDFEVNYLSTKIKSAAIQRNLGMELLSDQNIEPQFLVFLDDDIRIGKDYLSNLSKSAELENVAGCSGLALNPGKELRQLPRGLSGLFHRIFLLDSFVDGKLLKSGVNIPIRKHKEGVYESDWLIGCSLWNYGKVKAIRFEQDFYGSSLGEDVIFSVKAKSAGKLLVDSNVILEHLESEIQRPDKSEFWKMWVANRYRLISSQPSSILAKFAFVWANLGQQLVLYVTSGKNTEGHIAGRFVIIRATLRCIFKSSKT